MYPLLRSGEEALVDWEVSSLRPGEVVLARDASAVWILHRVVSVDPAGEVVLKGDYGPLVERRPLAEIWGKAIAFRSAPTAAVRRFSRTSLSAVIAALSALPRFLHPLARALVRPLGALERRRLPREKGDSA